MDIYGAYRPALEAVMERLAAEIRRISDEEAARTGSAVFEHLIYRIKGDESMREKCRKKGLPETTESALTAIRDAIGLRGVCRFIDDVYLVADALKSLPGVTVVEEKDYIRAVKPNGYRSYHLILSVEAPYKDVRGDRPGHFFAEVQLRTIAMDSWAALEHEMMYKHDAPNRKLLEAELKRCADELASCDVSMQTIRNMIRGKEDK